MNRKMRGLGPLFIITSVIVLMILLPSFSIIKSLFTESGQHWEHIKTYLLENYIVNSIILIVFVGIFTASIGTYLSWTLTRYNFKYKKIMFIFLTLPLAIPPYIGGYIYGGIFNYGGTLERILKNFDMPMLHINILSIPGAIFVFSLFLMPYTILITKSFFSKLPLSYFESAQLLGKNRGQVFRKVVFPLSITAIFGGTVLVMLEVLNDFGLVNYFGIMTFSTAIYKTWFGLGDLSSAIRLASILMVLVFVILSSESFLRRRIRISQPRSLSQRNKSFELSKKSKVVFIFVYTIYVLFSFIIPIIQLIQWTFFAKNTLQLRNLFVVVTDTLNLTIVVTIIVLIAGIIIGNYARLSKGLLSKFYSKVVILGYSIPASIIAVAVLSFFIQTDGFFKTFYQELGLKNLFLTSSLAMLTFALSLRFLAIGFNSIESGFKKMGTKYHDASLLLGKNHLKTFLKVDLPMLMPALTSAFILTFVDVLKELPLTLILRPFNYNTLATQVYTYAGDEMIHEASFYALIIVSISTIALVALSFIGKRGKHVKN
jgi:iron(III) transport system permease protein